MQYQQDAGLHNKRELTVRGDVVPPGDASTLSIISRIRDCVETETEAIRNASDYNAKESNARKSRLLYELGRATRGTDPDAFSRQYRDEFLALREALAENEAVLRAHVNAVTEVAGILQRAIERDEADGTYSSAGYGRYAGG